VVVTLGVLIIYFKNDIGKDEYAALPPKRRLTNEHRPLNLLVRGK